MKCYQFLRVFGYVTGLHGNFNAESDGSDRNTRTHTTEIQNDEAIISEDQQQVCALAFGFFRKFQFS